MEDVVEFNRPEKPRPYVVRRTLRETESMDPAIKSGTPIVATFFGQIHGIVIRHRGVGDPDLVYEIIVEDDEFWYCAKHGVSGHVHWLANDVELFKAALEWVNENSKKGD